MTTASAGLLAIGSSGIVGAAGTNFYPDDAYEHALGISEDSQGLSDQESFRDILKGIPEFDVSTNDMSVPTPQPAGTDDMQVEPQFMYPGDVNMWMTRTSYNDVIYAHCHFDVTYRLNDGDAPYDPCALGWEGREYDYLQHYTSSYVSFGHAGQRGVNFDYHDERDDCHCQKNNRHFGAKARKEAGNPNTRRVWGSLWHTYEDTTVASAGISGQGIVTVNLANDVKKWDHPVQSYIDER